MTEKDMRKLSRADLLEMLIAQSEEVQSLRQRLSEAEAALQKRELAINTSGSIAEAALQLNGVFEAVEAAGKQYLDNIQQLSQRQEAVCQAMEAESRKKADRLLAETEKKCAEMVAKAEAESRTYWNEVSRRLDAYYEEHAGLRELLAAGASKMGQKA